MSKKQILILVAVGLLTVSSIQAWLVVAPLDRGEERSPHKTITTLDESIQETDTSLTMIPIMTGFLEQGVYIADRAVTRNYVMRLCFFRENEWKGVVLVRTAKSAAGWDVSDVPEECKHHTGYLFIVGDRDLVKRVARLCNG